MFDLSGKRALVCGSTQGIGRACALRFAENRFHVVVNYSRSEAEARETLNLVEACGVRGLLVQCDVGSDAAVRDMLQTVEREFGRLDVLVNNAGTTWFIDHKNLEEMSEEKWDRILQVNLKGPFFCIRAAIPLLKKSGGGAGAMPPGRPPTVRRMAEIHSAGTTGCGSSSCR